MKKKFTIFFSSVVIMIDWAKGPDGFRYAFSGLFLLPGCGE